jgi:FKBP-type peptidyl-prolyl cis-trans isomerase
VIKLTVSAGADWQTPRPPYEVAFQWHACTITEFVDPMNDALDWRAHSAALGQGVLPSGLEAAISSMAKGEVARCVLPATLLKGATGDGTDLWAAVVDEAAQRRHSRLHMCLRLTAFTEVRDMTGDGRVRHCRCSAFCGRFVLDARGCVPPRGLCHVAVSQTSARKARHTCNESLPMTLLELLLCHARPGHRGPVSSSPATWETLAARLASTASKQQSKVVQAIKRKTREGTGSFPVDAPIQDATVRMHYTINTPDGGARAGPVLFDSRRLQGAPTDAEAAPMSVATGEGALPEGVEMALKLMLPGEACEVYLKSEDFGYLSCADEPPAGVPADQPLVFCIEMVGFDKQGHPQTMTPDEVRAATVPRARQHVCAVCGHMHDCCRGLPLVMSSCASLVDPPDGPARWTRQIQASR